MDLHNGLPSEPLSERQLRELLALYEIGHALCAIHDVDQLLQLAIDRMVSILEVEGCSIILLDEEHDELYFKVADAAHEEVQRRLREVRFPANRGVAGWVVREKVPLMVPDVAQDPRFYGGVDVHTGAKTQSLLCVPLQTTERMLGVLEAINKRYGPFVAEDIQLLQAFASPLSVAIENAQLIQELHAAREQLRAENLYLREAIGQAAPFDTLVGESPKMQEVYRLVERVLNTTATVLITGESGTGKELIARIVHYQGPRAAGPFIAVNCAAIPENLLEAELFGYERGAFTGAVQRKPGRFELAAGGTLFFDEVAEMSPTLQAKLLRALQDKTFERVGGTETLATDARIIAATNQDLDHLIGDGRFRRDLYYRLNVYPIPLPPLRQRHEDVLPLALHFLKQFSDELRKDIIGLSKEATELLVAYSWPGNVRELENVIERAVILCHANVVTAEELPLALREQPGTPAWSGETFKLPRGGIALSVLEKQLIQQALEQANQNKSQAAKLLGLSRTQLRTRLKHYGL